MLGKRACSEILKQSKFYSPVEGSKKFSFSEERVQCVVNEVRSLMAGDLNGGADRWPRPTHAHARARAQVGLWDVGSTSVGPRKSVNLSLFSSFFFIAAYAKRVFL